MKTKFIFLVLFMSLCKSAFATEETKVSSRSDVRSQFLYFSPVLKVSSPCLLTPTIGIGYRLQRGFHGMDVSCNGGISLGPEIGKRIARIFPAFQGTLLYHYYFKPNLHAQTYVGLGPTIFVIGGHFADFHLGIGPSLNLGRQWKSKTERTHFFEIGIEALVGESAGKSREIHPGIGLKYGFSF